MPEIIDGKLLAEALIQEVRLKIERLKKLLNKTPKIVTVLVGENPASLVYVKRKIKTASAIGVDAKLIHLKSDISNDELKETVLKFNSDSSITGILIQLPLPSHLDSQIVFRNIDFNKDIDAFSIYNAGLQQHNNSYILPCTPQGILQILKKYIGDNLSGKKAVIIGRSVIVGKPMLNILLNENCTVTIAHSRTLDIEKECANADILIAAAGSPKLVKKSWVRKGAFVIDVGINRVDGKLIGDVDFDNIKNHADYITPVPGGVGPLTIANLMLNACKLCCLQNEVNYEDI